MPPPGHPEDGRRVPHLGLPGRGPIGRPLLPGHGGARLLPSRAGFGEVPGPARGGQNLESRMRAEPLRLPSGHRKGDDLGMLGSTWGLRGLHRANPVRPLTERRRPRYPRLRASGTELGRLVGPSKKYGFLGFLTRAPGALGAPGGHPGLSLGVSGASGALLEKAGTHHEPNQKTYEPKRID